MNSLPGGPAAKITLVSSLSESLVTELSGPAVGVANVKTRLCTRLDVPKPGMFDCSCGYSRVTWTPASADGVLRLTTTRRLPIGGLVQVLASLSQVALQPSPGFRLPSSHCSPRLVQRLPSPHASIWQFVHPSQAVELLSSQVSPASTIPLGHTGDPVVVVVLVVVVVVVGIAGQLPGRGWGPHFATRLVFGLAGVPKSRQ